MASLHRRRSRTAPSRLTVPRPARRSLSPSGASLYGARHEVGIVEHQSQHRRFIILLLAGYCARSFGWQCGMIVPGLAALAVRSFVYNRICDGPEALNLLPVDVHNGNDPDTPDATPTASGVEDEELPLRQKRMKHVVFNLYVWLLALSYFVIYFVRVSISSWAYELLTDRKGIEDAVEAVRFRAQVWRAARVAPRRRGRPARDDAQRPIAVIVLWLHGVIVVQKTHNNG